uniref:Uncharacterized protein n=1 Tax=Anguilla anguilla TaxID=7936 RepID=A0A0E9RT48_ANGAN
MEIRVTTFATPPQHTPQMCGLGTRRLDQNNLQCF